MTALAESPGGFPRAEWRAGAGERARGESGLIPSIGLPDPAASRRERRMGKWCWGRGSAFSVRTNLLFFSSVLSSRCIECAGIEQLQLSL